MAVLDYTDVWLADPDSSGYPGNPDRAASGVIDLNALERDCDATGFLMIDAPDFDNDHFQDARLGSYLGDGEVQAARRYGTQRIRLQLAARVAEQGGGGIGALLDLADDLAAALDRPGVLAIQLKGDDEPVFYDYSPSPIEHLLRGQRSGLHKLTEALADPDGMPIEILATHPWGRLAPVTIAAVNVDNGVNNRELLVNNPGNRDAEIKAVLTPSAGEVAGWRYGIRARGNLTEFRTLYSKAASTATMRKDTSSAASTGATGGNAAVTTFATFAGLVWRFRDTRTPVDETALEGQFRAYARVKPQGGTTQGRFFAQLRYGFNGEKMSLETLRRVELDFTDIGTPDWAEYFMGIVVVPKGAKQLDLDFFASREAGDTNLAVDQIILEPADRQHAHLSVPGFRHGAWSRERYDADELAGTGTLKRGTFRLNATGELGRVTIDFELPAGVHTLVGRVRIREPDPDNETRKIIGQLEIIRDPTGTPTTVANLPLRNRKNQLWTRLRRRLNYEVSAADEAAAVKFRLQVRFTEAALAGRRIQIAALTHRFVRAVTNATPAVLDSNVLERRAFGRDGATDLQLFPLVHENEPPLLPPGNSLLVVSAIDLPKAPGYADVDAREPVGLSALTRQTSVALQITPRVTH